MQGAIVLGPSVLGRIFPKIHMSLFPARGVFVGQTMAWVGIMQFIFSTSVKMDFTILVGRGRKAAVIAIASIGVPFLAVLGLCFLLHNQIAESMAGGPFLVGIAASMATSHFLVVYQFLAEFRLLSSELGRLSLAIAMLSEMVSWALLVYVDTNITGHFRPEMLLLQVGLLAGMGLLMLLVVRPVLMWVVRQTPPGKQVKQGYVVGVLVGALLMGVGSGAIGLSVLEGPIFFGMAVPDGPPLGPTVAEKTDTICRTLFLPLFFYYVGQRFNVGSITDWPAWRATVLLILVNRITKFSGTLVATICCGIPLTEALSLSSILNSKGFMDLLIYSIWDHYRLIDDQTHAALVASALVTTMIVSPLVTRMCSRSRQYNPHSRRTIQHTMPFTELRLLTCIHDEDALPSILNLLQVTSPTRENPLCIYVMHLMDLVGRAAPLLIPYKPDRPAAISRSKSKSIFTAFYNLQRTVGGDCVLVQPYVCISPFSSMHDDVCSLALQTKVSLILLPFHKRFSLAGSLDVADYGLQTCNPNILKHAPCSVGILVDRGAGRFVAGSAVYRIGVLFLGGPDDREALAYADRMVGHPSAVVTVTRVVLEESYGVGGEKAARERHLDDEAVREFRRKRWENGKVGYREMVVRDGEEAINSIYSMEEVYDLMVVGRCQWCSSELIKCLSIWSQNPELGVIGDLCFSSESDCFGGNASVLVMQQQTAASAALCDFIDSKRI
ncbi:hypothetical protein ACLOJK_031358 [Asimina triloba]